MVRRLIFMIMFCMILGSVIPVQTTYAYPNLTRYDVIIDIGHGGIDGGTSANGVLEKDINLVIGTKLFHELKKKSYRVGTTRLHDYSISDDSLDPVRSRHLRDLKQRKLIADVINPKIFLSLHVNWSKNNNRRGPVIIYQVSGESYHLAQIIQDHLNNYYGMKKSIRKGDPYFLMKKLDMPSIIVELGYISNGNDFKILTEEETQDELVSAIVEAIEEYFLLYPVENEEKTK